MIDKMILFIRSYKAKKQFKYNAILGNDVEIGYHASCFSKNTKEKIKIGDNCSIWAILYCDETGVIKIGHHSTIRYKSYLGSSIGIYIGNYVIISNNVTIFDHNSHPTSPKMRIEMCKSGFYSELWDWKYADKKEINIQDNVWIGQNVLICKGVTIGRGSIVAANAVVVKDVPEYTVVAGNPARVVKQIKNDIQEETVT